MLDSLVQNVIEAQVQSAEQFPVDFDEFWQWLEMSRKDNAKRSFMACKYVENEDYQLLKIEELRPQGGSSSREQIKLTVDCAKSFAMTVNTEKGKEVRKYYLECERKLMKLLVNNSKQLPAIENSFSKTANLMSECQTACEGLTEENQLIMKSILRHKIEQETGVDISKEKISGNLRYSVKNTELTVELLAHSIIYTIFYVLIPRSKLVVFSAATMAHDCKLLKRAIDEGKRPLVREALHLLEAEGFISIKADHHCIDWEFYYSMNDKIREYV